MSDTVDERVKKQAYFEISQKTDAAMKLIREAEALADSAQVSFSFSIEYGMGGTYYPARPPNKGDGSDDDENWTSSGEQGWMSSSSRC